MLTSQEADRYQQDGFLILRDVLPPVVVEKIASQRPSYMLSWYLRPLEWAINLVFQQVSHQVLLYLLALSENANPLFSCRILCGSILIFSTGFGARPRVPRGLRKLSE